MAKLIPGVNDLATVNPSLAAKWHPTKNSDLMPFQVTAGSHRKVWWLGECGHEWQAQVCNRCNGSQCPVCAETARVKTRVDTLIEKNGSLAARYPQFISEWHPTKNGDLMPESTPHKSNKTVWWRCSEGHEWQARIANRIRGQKCPVCTNKKILVGYNDLSTACPELAAEWHPTKNGGLTPSQVMTGSSKKVWWMGKCGHEWEAVVVKRCTQGRGCPACRYKKASETRKKHRKEESPKTTT